MSLTRILAFAALTASALVSVTACSGGTVNVGSNDQKIKKSDDGGAADDSATCTLDGETYAIGESVPSPDGCNTCTCAESGFACTLIACGPAGDCQYDGWSRKTGETFPATDGFNTCTCEADGAVFCTEINNGPGCGTPRESPPGTACAQVVTYGKNPNGGTCCPYASPCAVPSDYTQHADEASCESAAK